MFPPLCLEMYNPLYLFILVLLDKRMNENNNLNFDDNNVFEERKK